MKDFESKTVWSNLILKILSNCEMNLSTIACKTTSYFVLYFWERHRDIGSNTREYGKWIYEKLINGSIKRAYSDISVARIPQTSKINTFATIVNYCCKTLYIRCF